ncbi:MAG: PP2C family protein-serine/threonine phosphatase, partial [Armatimonadota bacterium]|nr:PP2C family protein-serine/threonine phosphatase [Armatimonadota bacterium]
VLRVRADGVEFLAPNGAAIGVLPPEEFRDVLEEVETPLLPGDTLVFYSDGITDATNAEGEQFGQERFLDILLSAGSASAEVLTKQIGDALARFVGDAPQQDDITLLVVSAKGETGCQASGQND